MTELSLPPSVERRNKLDISLGYCNDIDPGKLVSLGPGREVRVDEPEQLIDFLQHDAEPDQLYFVQHLRTRRQEWEYVCFARHERWTVFCSVFSTSLAYNPIFADGQRRRLCCGGTRILARDALERAFHASFQDSSQALVAALEMNLSLSEAMTGKNLSNGFNIGGSKTLVYVHEQPRRPLVSPDQGREFARFMACFHNSLIQTVPVFIGTGSDLNFHEHGELYYDLCSRISPCYVGNTTSARRWGRLTSGNTTVPTAQGVLECMKAVVERLDVPESERGVLVKGVGGVGGMIAQTYAEAGWKVYATELRASLAAQLVKRVGPQVQLVDEEEWSSLRGVSVFSPNASSGSITRENLPVLRDMGVRAVVGGENNIRDRDVVADEVFSEWGIWTFADFLLNGGGAWIVDAEMVERPVENVHDWFRSYQVPTVLRTIDHAEKVNRSPESLFREFIDRKVRELIA